MTAPGPLPRRSSRRLLVVLFAAGIAFGAQPVADPSAPIIELPPMIVMESSKAPPWLYAAAGDTEYLSRCSPSVTRKFIAAHLEIYHALRTLVPAEFLATFAVPTVSVIAPVESMASRDDAVVRAMLGAERSVSDAPPPELPGGRPPPPRPGRYEFLPNQRLDDADMMAVFTFLNEGTFDSDRMVASPDFVYMLLTRRTPMLPQWLIEGVAGVVGSAQQRASPLVLPPMAWNSPSATDALQRDPEARRMMIAMNDLFAPDAVLGEGHRHPVRDATWRAQTTLFVRWSLDPANAPARDSLWRLVARVSREPMSEKIFTECFGFGYSDLRDRLSDYLPTAVKEPVRLPVHKGSSASFELKPATPAQIARLRGEWERLEIPYVRRLQPALVPHYVDQARLTFRRATSRGERDPALLVAVALCELDAGDTAAAVPLLEAAVAAHTPRPRVYFELARLRWGDLVRGAPDAQRYSLAQLRPVLDPLATALTLSPPLPEAYLLALDAWLRCRERAPPETIAALAEGAALFRRIPAIGLRVAFLQAMHGQRAHAVAGLAEGLEFLTDPAMRAEYQRLSATLTAPTPAPTR